MSEIKAKVLVICPYPLGKAPSQRFRFEQFLPFLEEQGYEITVKTFLDQATWDLLYQPGLFYKKTIGMLKSTFKRFSQLATLHRYDFVFMHREALFFGPPVIEWLMVKIFRKKILYDFDDAIWLKNHSDSNALLSFTKWYSKVHSICKWVTHIQCGNAYLADFSKQYNSNVDIVPTTIDTDGHHNTTIDYSRTRLTIGWTGSHSTMHYLKFIVPVINSLKQKYAFDFLVISDRPPELEIEDIQFCEWKKATEIHDLARLDIGIMPLKNNEWSEGKCAFKGLQYMSLGIPTVISPVGMNTTLVQHEQNGFLADSEEEWFIYLERLLQDRALRQLIGANGQKTVVEHYSVNALKDKYLHLFGLMAKK